MTAHPHHPHFSSLVLLRSLPCTAARDMMGSDELSHMWMIGQEANTRLLGFTSYVRAT